MIFSPPGLDYKKFSDGDSNPVDVIAPVLKESNVNVIAKLAAKMPIKVSLHSVISCEDIQALIGLDYKKFSDSDSNQVWNPM